MSAIMRNIILILTFTVTLIPVQVKAEDNQQQDSTVVVKDTHYDAMCESTRTLNKLINLRYGERNLY